MVAEIVSFPAPTGVSLDRSTVIRRWYAWQRSYAGQLTNQMFVDGWCGLLATWTLDEQGHDVLVVRWDHLRPETAYTSADERAHDVAFAARVYVDSLRVVGIAVEEHAAPEVDDTARRLVIKRRVRLRKSV